MATGDRIDPGPGWRLLEVGERRPDKYQTRIKSRWVAGVMPGIAVESFHHPCRVRTAPRTIKGIATRATVRAVSVNGSVWETVVRNDSGLQPSHMEYARAIFDKAVDDARNGFRIPKYIMFEIQRGPNDF